MTPPTPSFMNTVPDGAGLYQYCRVNWLGLRRWVRVHGAVKVNNPDVVYLSWDDLGEMAVKMLAGRLRRSNGR